MFGLRKQRRAPVRSEQVPAAPAEAMTGGDGPQVPLPGPPGSEGALAPGAASGASSVAPLSEASQPDASLSAASQPEASPGDLAPEAPSSDLGPEGPMGDSAPLDDDLGEGGSSTLSEDERAERLRQLIELVDMVRPIIQQDGGDLTLVSADVEAGTVELQLQGACSSCAISATTLQAGVERILKDRLPWVTEVIGGVDEDIDWYESAAMGRGAYVPKW